MSYRLHSEDPREAIAAMESTTNRPLIVNFLHQVNALPQGAVGTVDLTEMWESAGKPLDAKPAIWRDAAFEAYGPREDDPGVVLEDGRFVATRMLCIDYLMRLDIELDYLSLAFAKIVDKPWDVFAMFAHDPTPAKAAIAISMLVCADPTLSLADGVAQMRGFITVYAQHGEASSLTVESKVAQMQRALRGEDPVI